MKFEIVKEIDDRGHVFLKLFKDGRYVSGSVEMVRNSSEEETAVLKMKEQIRTMKGVIPSHTVIYEEEV